MTYATDLRCHNAEPGTFGHECGQPAEWIGRTAAGFESGFCTRCRASGHEGRRVVAWRPATVWTVTHPLMGKLRPSGWWSPMGADTAVFATADEAASAARACQGINQAEKRRMMIVPTNYGAGDARPAMAGG